MLYRRAKREDAFAAACGCYLLYVRSYMVCAAGPLSTFFNCWTQWVCCLPAAARAPHGVGCWPGYAFGSKCSAGSVYFLYIRFITGPALDGARAARSSLAFHLCVAGALPQRAVKGVRPRASRLVGAEQLAAHGFMDGACVLGSLSIANMGLAAFDHAVVRHQPLLSSVVAE